MTHSVLVGILDSMVVSSLGRLPKGPRGVRIRSGTVLDKYIKNKSLRIGMDPDWGLRDEWIECAGREFVEALIVFWEGWSAIEVAKRLGCLSPANLRKLRQMGFPKGIDRRLLKIALGITYDKRIVSSDRDFWDPAAANPRSCVGDHNACVARYLRDKIGVQVCTLRQLLGLLGGFSKAK